MNQTLRETARALARGLTQVLGDQRMTKRQEQAAHERLLRGAGGSSHFIR